MGQSSTKNDWDWSYTDEPHATRRKQILEAHPEIKQYFGIDLSFKYVVSVMVFTQIIIAYLLKDSDWLLVVIQTYLVSGTINHSLTLAIHEISHNMAYGTQYPFANRIFGIFANLPMGVPMSISFKKFHTEHHRNLGEYAIDTDVPTDFEARIFTTTFGKLVWLFLQPIFYGLRPILIYKKAIFDLEIVNFISQLIFDLLIYHYMGPKAVLFLFGGCFVGLGIHPLAGHYISDHYVFQTGQETYSYYGLLNLVTFNVGYHVEHHDFPYVCGEKLALVCTLFYSFSLSICCYPDALNYTFLIHATAPEFYEPLMIHSSWLHLMWTFCTDPRMGLRSRTKRIMPHSGGQFYGLGRNSTSVVYQFLEEMVAKICLNSKIVKD